VAEKRLDHAPGDELAAAALAAGIISGREAEQLSAAAEARDEVIRVDAFDPKEFAELRH